MSDYRFRVSDAYFVPLRGWMLRLKLQEGDFDPKMLKPGSSLRLFSPTGEEHMVTIQGLSNTGGFQRKQRVDAYGEFDVIIPAEDGFMENMNVAIGWQAGPAR